MYGPNLTKLSFWRHYFTETYLSKPSNLKKNKWKLCLFLEQFGGAQIYLCAISNLAKFDIRKISARCGKNHQNIPPILPEKKNSSPKKADAFKLPIAILVDWQHVKMKRICKKRHLSYFCSNKLRRKEAVWQDRSDLLERVDMHTEKTFWNLVNSNRNPIVFTIFWVIWIQINRKMVNTIWFRFE